MTMPLETPKNLATLLEETRDSIQQHWFSQISQLPGFANRLYSDAELRAGIDNSLDTVITYLNTGSYEVLRDRLSQFNWAALTLGAGVNDMIDALFMLKESIMTHLRDVICPGTSPMLEACSRLDNLLRYSVGFIAGQYTTSMNQKLQRQQENTASLLEIVRTAAETLDLDEVLRRVGEAINDVAGTPTCAFSLIDLERKLVIPYPYDAAMSTPSGERIPPMPLDSLDAFEQAVITAGEPMITRDAQDDPRILQEWAQAYGIRSILAVPFIAKGSVVAIAFAMTYDEARDFSPEQVKLACGIADAVSLAIENARLYDKTREVAVIEERERLAHELHDNLAQLLGAMQLKASQAAANLTHARTQKAAANLDDLQEMISEAHTDVRETIFNMRTVISPTADFLTTLQAYLDAYTTRYNIDVSLHLEGEPDLVWDVGTSVQVMRIIQEGLTNVRKHASNDQVYLTIRPDDCFTQFILVDHGSGFNPKAVAEHNGHHLGLNVMRERAESIGGQLAIDSQPGRGTRLTLTVPQPQKKEHL